MRPISLLLVVLAACGPHTHVTPRYARILVDDEGHHYYTHHVCVHATMGDSDVEEMLSLREPLPWLDEEPLDRARAWVDAHSFDLGAMVHAPGRVR